MNIIEIIGNLGILAVVGSMFMKDMIKLRTLNAIGCLLFVVYGGFIESFPVFATNGIALVANSYHLFKIFRGKK